MHIAYSALCTNSASQENDDQTDLELRIRAYRLTCDKYSKEIAAIQRYLPGWQPTFNYNTIHNTFYTTTI